MGSWKSDTNQDLALARIETSCQHPNRRVLGKFLPSQHRLFLITASHRITTTSKLVKRWNFRKANWKRYGTITNNLAKKLPLPDARNANTAYQAFCSITIVTIINLWNIHVIIPCRRSFSVLVIISGISPVCKPSLVYFVLKAILVVAISYTSPVGKPFLIYFICVFIGCSLGSSFRYSPVFKPFL